jgi:hypothetical protein
MAQLPDALSRQLIEDILAFLPADLDDDADGRRAVATRVLGRLEHDGHAAILEWRRRRFRARDHCSWQTFLRVLVLHEALAYLDSHRFDPASPVGEDTEARER